MIGYWPIYISSGLAVKILMLRSSGNYQYWFNTKATIQLLSSVSSSSSTSARSATLLTLCLDLSQSGISLNLGTGQTGHATLFKQWEGALLFTTTSSKCSKIFHNGGRRWGEHCYFVFLSTDYNSTRLGFPLFQRKHLMLENKSIIHCKESLGCSNIPDRSKRSWLQKQTGPV